MLLPLAYTQDLLPEYDAKLLPLGQYLNQVDPDLQLNYGSMPRLTRTTVGGSCLDFATGLMRKRGKVLYLGRSLFCFSEINDLHEMAVLAVAAS